MTDQVYRNKMGQLHRKDGPAVIYSDGIQYWYINGNRHRENGPAAIFPNGTQYWFIKDQLHREDGPAIIYANESKEWWLNGRKYTESEYYMKLYNIGKISENELFLKLL